MVFQLKTIQTYIKKMNKFKPLKSLDKYLHQSFKIESWGIQILNLRSKNASLLNEKAQLMKRIKEIDKEVSKNSDLIGKLEGLYKKELNKLGKAITKLWEEKTEKNPEIVDIDETDDIIDKVGSVLEQLQNTPKSKVQYWLGEFNVIGNEGSFTSLLEQEGIERLMEKLGIKGDAPEFVNALVYEDYIESI